MVFNHKLLQEQIHQKELVNDNYRIAMIELQDKL